MNMMKDSTSLMPLFTFNTATIMDQIPPATAAAIRHNGTWMIAGTFKNTPTIQAASVPTTYCPSAPILNTPVWKENATESPVKMIGDAYTIAHTMNFGLPKTPVISFP